MEYCTCVLPIRMVRHTADMYKTWCCAKCEKPVDPKSKMLDKNVDSLILIKPTRNEAVIQDKLNEILELLRANGAMTI